MRTALKQDRQAKVKVFSSQENECIWMRAGVVNYKLCDNAFDCMDCPFDKAMSRTAQIDNLRQVRRTREYFQRECRHMLTGRVQYRFCANNYRCDVCEFDQGLDEEDLAAAEGTVHTQKVAGFAMADGYYYHRGHSWARIEHGGMVRVGIDEFALKLVGRLSAIDLPKIGSHLAQTEVGWTLWRDEKEARMLAPMNGIVLATNQRLLSDMETAKRDPFDQGWLLVVEPLRLKQNLANLLFGREAASWLSAESQRLQQAAISKYGMPLAATGGEIVDDIYGALGDKPWEELVHEFLLT
jgi:glycine cleavage system H lipoate-binding protein